MSGFKINPNAFRSGITKAKEDRQVELEPGIYIAVVKSLRSSQTKSDQVILDMFVPECEETKGGKISIFYSLAEERIHWFIQDMGKLGYEFNDEDADNAAEVLDQIAEDIKTNQPQVRVKAKRTGDFVNYNIQKRMEDDVAPAPVAPTLPPPPVANSEPVKTAPKAPAVAKPAPAPVAAPAAPVAAPVANVAKYGELAKNDRTVLKGILALEHIRFQVTKATTDDQIRDAILAHRASLEEVASPTPDEPEAEPAAEVEPEAEPEVEPEAELNEQDPPAEEVVSEDQVVEEEVELVPGMAVKAMINGKVFECKVHKIDEASGKVQVRNMADQKLYAVTGDKISL
jgi:hypothetical protein